tara:strand:- start:104 stop:514 length:411 start_codon:yes stop_codon:yes gene_type:complete
MTKFKDTLDNTLGITDNVEKKLEVVSPKPKTVIKTNNEGNDFEYQRQNFYSLVEKGQDAIEGILDLARESEHPRTYEVAGQLIKNVAEVTEKLGDLHLKMQKLKELPDRGPKNVTNALFVGSTTELQKMLKNNGSK